MGSKGGGSSGGGGTNTVVQNSSPPPQVMAAYQNVMNQAQNLVGQPLQQYQGPLVAGFSPDQSQAMGTITNSQGLSQPYINAATQYAGIGSAPVWNRTMQFSPQTGQMGGAGNSGSFQPLSPGAGMLNGLQGGQPGGNPMANSQMGFQPSGGPVFSRPQGMQGQQGGGAQPLWQQDPNSGIGPVNTGTAVDQFMSPYTQDVVQATQNLFNQQNATQQSQLAGNAASAGALGGDRVGVAQAQLAQNQALAENPQLANILQQGYNTALGEFNTQQALGASTMGADASRASQTAYTLGGLGQEAQGSALSGASAQLQSGALQQQLAQEQLNIPYEQFLQQQTYPFQSTGWEAGIAEGLGGNMGGTSTTTGPGQSLTGQIAGLGTAGLGLYGLGSSSGLFGSLGSLFGGKHGGAIRRASGGLVPDYDSGGGILGDLESAIGLGNGAAMAGGYGGILDFIAANPELLAFAARRGGAIKRDSGGLIPSTLPGIPDVSISYVPSAQGSGGGGRNGIPSPPGAYHDPSQATIKDLQSALKESGLMHKTPGSESDGGFGSIDQSVGDNTGYDPMVTAGGENPSFGGNGLLSYGPDDASGFGDLLSLVGSRRGGVTRKYDGGGLVPAQPQTPQTQIINPQQAALQKYLSLPVDKLQQLTTQYPANSQMGQTVRRVLQRKMTTPDPSSAPPTQSPMGLPMGGMGAPTGAGYAAGGNVNISFLPSPGYGVNLPQIGQGLFAPPGSGAPQPGAPPGLAGGSPALPQLPLSAMPPPTSFPGAGTTGITSAPTAPPAVTVPTSPQGNPMIKRGGLVGYANEGAVDDAGDDAAQVASLPVPQSRGLTPDTVTPKEETMSAVAPKKGAKTEVPDDSHEHFLSKNASMGLLSAGLGMMASRSPFATQAIGEGGQQGLQTYLGQENIQPKLALEREQADLTHQQAQLAGLNVEGWRNVMRPQVEGALRSKGADKPLKTSTAANGDVLVDHGAEGVINLGNFGGSTADTSGAQPKPAAPVAPADPAKAAPVQVAQNSAPATDAVPAITTLPGKGKNAPPVSVPAAGDAGGAKPALDLAQMASQIPKYNFPGGQATMNALIASVSKAVPSGMQLYTDGRLRLMPGLEDAKSREALAGKGFVRHEDGSYSFPPGYVEAEAGLDAAKAEAVAPFKIMEAAAHQAGRPITVGPNQTVTTGAEALPDASRKALQWAAERVTAGKKPDVGGTSSARPAGGKTEVPSSADDQTNTGLVRNPDGSLSSVWNPVTEGLARDYTKLHTEVVTQAKDAQTREKQLQLMEKSFEDMKSKGTDTGYYTPALGQAAAMAKAVGIDTGKIRDLTGLPLPSPEAVGDIQTANKVARGLMGEILKKMYPQRITNMDITLNQGIAPGNDVDEVANKNLISSIREQNKYDKQFATDFLDHESKNLKQPLKILQFEQQFYAKHGYAPITGTFFKQTPEGVQSEHFGIPPGLPAESKQIGTTEDGTPVWESPDGKRFKVKP